MKSKKIYECGIKCCMKGSINNSAAVARLRGSGSKHL